MTFPAVHPISSGTMKLHRFRLPGSSMLPNLTNGQELAFFGEQEDEPEAASSLFGPRNGDVSVKHVVGLLGG